MKILKLFVIGLFIGNCIGLSAQKQSLEKPSEKAGYSIGDVATDFSLKNIDEKQISLSSIPDAKGYIVIFTSNVCPYALMYEDRIIELHNKMAPQGYPVVAINSNDPEVEAGDSYEKMQLRAKEKSFPFVYLNDDKQTIYPQYGATKTPHVFLLDENLKVQYIGAIDDNAQSVEDVKIKYVENAIAALEKGEKVDPSITKAVGCSIKTKSANGRNAGSAERGPKGGPPSPEKLMEMMDSDKDQKISKSEVQGRLAQDFDRLDSNKDGFLTSKELATLKRKGRGM